MPESAAIVASVLDAACATVAEIGGAPPPVPGGTGEGKVPLAAFVAFGQAAAAELRRPGLGWAIGSRLAPADLGPLGALVAAAPTLGAGFRLMHEAFAVVQGDSVLSLEVEGDAAVLAYRILDPAIWPRDQDAALTMAFCTGLIRRAAGPGWQPGRLEFEHAENGAGRDGAAGFAPRCETVHGQRVNALHFPARLLDLPMPGADPAGFRAGAQPLRAAAREAERRATTARRVRRVLLARLGADAADQGAVADALGLTRRTLRRRLADEGTSFAAILAECRTGCAARLLADGALPLAEIAARLGYSDQSAFERAFRARAGLTPTAFRRDAARR